MRVDLFGLRLSEHEATQACVVIIAKRSIATFMILDI